MAIPFADIEASISATALEMLANAEGTLDGHPVTGIFDAGFENGTLAGYGTVGSSPTFSVLSAAVPAKPEGKQVVITSGFGIGTYRIANAYPDAGGVTTLHLIA